MNFHVTNKALCVGDIRIIGVSSSSVFLIGDTQTIVCSSIFDTPPEAVSIGPLTPLAAEEEEKEAEG
jgi:spore germination protein PD